MKILDGKLVAAQIKAEIASEVKEHYLDKGLDPPHVAAILVGDDPASQTYVSAKEKACQEVGFSSSVYRYPDTISEARLLEAVEFLNNDPQISGFIVQLPLPAGINEHKIIERINPSKDIDGFHPVNIGKMVLGQPCFLPATPMGIITLLERYGIETMGKHCVVLGRSHIVGTPVSILLSRKAPVGNATVTICHSHSKDIASIASTADILIVALGRLGYVTYDMVKKDAVVIDVGVHRIPTLETKSGFKLAGDVRYDEVAGKCSYITPVPGGVGPMTIVSLLQNTLKAARKEI
jgi:methylenetetrahydrofolate dehydrogenase (NADP+)/methenyltetrahydrofolate cyclohydrolase